MIELVAGSIVFAGVTRTLLSGLVNMRTRFCGVRAADTTLPAI